MTAAIIYIRVSTTGQAEEGVSLEAQEAKARAWADLNGYTVAGVHCDAGISGTKADRPGLAAALDAIGKGDALVVYSLSRLARSTKHTIEISETLARKGADLVSLSEKIDTTTAAGKMVFRMLAVMAEFERDLVSERTTTALQHKKAKGQRVGSIPYGKRLSEDGITLEADSHEQEVIRLVKLLRQGGLSYRKIGAELDARQMKPRGEAWNPKTIRAIAEAA